MINIMNYCNYICCLDHVTSHHHFVYELFMNFKSNIHIYKMTTGEIHFQELTIIIVYMYKIYIYMHICMYKYVANINKDTQTCVRERVVSEKRNEAKK